MTQRSAGSMVNTRRELWLATSGLVLVLAAGPTLFMVGLNGGFRGTECTFPALSGDVVDVTFTDMGAMMGGWGAPMRVLASSARVNAGAVSFRVVNAGMTRHELLVLPLPVGQAVGTRPISADGQVDETAALGEASRSCGVGVGEGIQPGATGWVTMRLTAGRYELVCNRVNHYRAGMSTELDVTATRKL